MSERIKAGDLCAVCKMPAPADGIAGHTARCWLLDNDPVEMGRRERERQATILVAVAGHPSLPPLPMSLSLRIYGFDALRTHVPPAVTVRI